MTRFHINKKAAGFTPLGTPQASVGSRGEIANGGLTYPSGKSRASVLTGFTLIELLVVISIIGFLATFAVVALNNARAKTRDARRLADFKQIQTALGLFYDSQGRYPIPSDPGTWTGTWTMLSNCLTQGSSADCGFTVSNYTPALSVLPQDPRFDAGDGFPTYYYSVYGSGCNGQQYRLAVYLETDHQALESDLDGSFFSNNEGCEDSNQGYCIGVGSCGGW